MNPKSKTSIKKFDFIYSFKKNTLRILFRNFVESKIPSLVSKFKKIKEPETTSEILKDFLKISRSIYNNLKKSQNIINENAFGILDKSEPMVKYRFLSLLRYISIIEKKYLYKM